jgi:hypothetical protein
LIELVCYKNQQGVRMEFLIWALAGWCGTPWRPRIPPGTGTPVSPIDPWVPWKVAGIVGGIAGGWLVSHFLGLAFSEPMPGLTHRAFADPMPGIVGAIIGGRVLGDIVDRFMRR